MLSRVADSLFWMARYLERAEHAARVVEVNLDLMLDQTAGMNERWRQLREALDSPADNGDAGLGPYESVRALGFDGENPASIRHNIAAARECARQVREQVSTEMFEQLNAMYFMVRQTNLEDIWNDQPYEFFRSIRTGSHLFHGITDASISHDQGWFFIYLGRYLERAIGTTRMLGVYLRDAPGEHPGRQFEAERYLSRVGLLRSSSAYESYLRRFRHGLETAPIAEFLLLDEAFPRAVRFAADRVQTAIRAISRDTGSSRTADLERLAGRLRGHLEFADIREVMAGGLQPYLDHITTTAEEIGTQVYRTFIGYPIADLAS